MKKILLILSVSIMVLACSAKDPLQEKFTTYTTQEQFDAILAKLEPEDQVLLISAAYYSAANGESLDGMTYAQIVEKGRQIEKDFLKQTTIDANADTDSTAVDTDSTSVE